VVSPGLQRVLPALPEGDLRVRGLQALPKRSHPLLRLQSGNRLRQEASCVLEQMECKCVLLMPLTCELRGMPLHFSTCTVSYVNASVEWLARFSSCEVYSIPGPHPVGLAF
jgi:hypothetical protein